MNYFKNQKEQISNADVAAIAIIKSHNTLQQQLTLGNPQKTQLLVVKDTDKAAMKNTKSNNK
jgi:hypothetical protein